LAPYLDEQTIAIVHVDVARAEPGVVLNRWVDIVPEAARYLEPRREYWVAVHRSLIGASVADAYVVVSLADVPVRAPMLVARGGDEASRSKLVAELKAVLKDSPGLEVAEREDAVVVAPREAFERLEQRHPDPRAELEAALTAAGDHAVQFVLLPTDNDRRVIEELMPTLPLVLGGGPSMAFTHGVRWLAIGGDVDPPTLSVVVQSADAAAAESLLAGFKGVLRAVKTAGSAVLPPLATALELVPPTVEGDRLVVQLNAARTRATLLAAQDPLRALQLARWSEQNSLRLRQLALGVLNHESAKHAFPPAYLADGDDKPLLSWRVCVLPFLGEPELALYRQFHLDEPWDSPHNKALIPKMPEMFRSPASRHPAREGLSTYCAVVGPHTAFPGKEGITWKQLTDGSSKTVLFVDVDDDHAEIWTKPGGLPFDGEKLPDGMGGQFPEGIFAAFCDGHYKLLTNPPIEEAMLRALFTIDGGEPIP